VTLSPVYLARGYVKSACAQVDPLPLVDEREKENHAGALWGTDPTQAEHHDPLVVGNRLKTVQKQDAQ